MNGNIHRIPFRINRYYSIDIPFIFPNTPGPIRTMLSFCAKCRIYTTKQNVFTIQNVSNFMEYTGCPQEAKRTDIMIS